jgi:IS30 family transposase
MGYGVALSKQSYMHLSDAARETLSLGLTHDQSLRAIASMLGRAPTTRQPPTRNAGHGAYRACTAYTLASARAQPAAAPARILLDPWLEQYVRTHLGQGRPLCQDRCRAGFSKSGGER